ncbi:DNA-directed RNA polymeras-like protein I subunit [Pseudovirgaria hyperparasitica]|uniref:DNA-directed RNA polymerase n=1 Tax=Pseudovirgaria hyperparasitica TaxID=470096 RepID=A0A6A6VUB0_9PEZI|nr:DNA-directed RNA polymeras-like protein I subunit [Pseudovirgaria hyperparasitica]KAF2753803.1 DNA-directed RNA polymeras-like protein I subunit [Pseudovirgaria hyperparasitica]
MDQILKLLRAKCIFCHHFRLSPDTIDYYRSVLLLLRHGLLNEIGEMEQLGLGRTRKGEQKDNASDDEDESTNSEERIRFINKAIKRSRSANKQSGQCEQISTTIASARKAALRDLFQDLGKATKCAREDCKGVSPKFRKDRYTKIFKMPFSEKQKKQNDTVTRKIGNPVLLVQRQKEALEKHARKMDVDEAVADLDSAHSEDEEGEEDSEDLQMNDMTGDIIQAEASMTTATTQPGTQEKETQLYISSEEVRAALQLLFDREQDILTMIYTPHTHARDLKRLSPDIFFIKTLLISPNKYRPTDKTPAGVSEHQRNKIYNSILKLSEQMSTATKRINDANEELAIRASSMNELQRTWLQLQEAVNSLSDNTRGAPLNSVTAKQAANGIKQVLEKKAGLFRMNMMGKRVNYAARSVISPDPNIETNEIGVPPVFAQRLTYPEPVTNHNFYELKQAVINGPRKWPGAVAVESEDGVVTSLLRKNDEERLAVANQLLAPSNTSAIGARNKKVHRHLNNGDVVIMNRQPTLHKPSMMAHRARVLPGEKTIRMHYSNCNTYNADFDGDEMNMHFPQNEIARAEALMIADTDHQYLSGTAGAPLRGLIQDHISISVWLCNRDTLFDRDHYQQLVYAALRPEDNHTTTGVIETVAPAIFKPSPRWTGKQVITTLLKNLKPASHPGLTLKSKSQTSPKLWGPGSEEGVVIFKDGEFLCGILDKRQIGPKHGGLVSAVYEAYGHTAAGKLLSSLGRLLTKLLHMNAFSCGVEDLILTPTGESNRREALREADVVGLKAASEYVSLSAKSCKELDIRLERVLRDDELQQKLDLKVNGTTKDMSAAVTNACLPVGLIKPFPRNFMQTMTQSGAKGSDVNAKLITCNLGQQTLEGRRVPVMVSGKSLPCFKPYETNVRAGGYIVDRFLTGIRPQEYYFHAMAGREGLIDTAVKTSRSGYLQRCLVKGMEGLKVEYDTSVRDTDGSLVQVLYGEDGLDVAKAAYLEDFKFQADNFLSLVESTNLREDFTKVQSDEAIDATKAAHKKFKRSGDLGSSDPALSQFAPGRHCGSTSERFFEARRKYVESNPDKLIKKKKADIVCQVTRQNTVTKKNFENAMDMKYLKSVVEPGEAVGIVAGQSIGEPSTQMTLNTFHLAGHSSKNVTLGIPRLREIVMTASAKISTPEMTLPLRNNVSEEEGQKLAKYLDRLPLSAIIDTASVTEKLGQGIGHGEARMYEISLHFYPSKEYCEEYNIKVADVMNAIKDKLIPGLQKRVRIEAKRKAKERSLSNAKDSDALPDIGASAGRVEEARQTRRRGDNDDSDVEDEDDDADAAKARQNKDDEDDYDAPDQDEEEMANEEREEREATPEDEAYGSAREGSVESEAGSDSSPSDDEGDNDSDTSMTDAPSATPNLADFEDTIKAYNADVTAVKFRPNSLKFTLEYSATAPKTLMLNHVEQVCSSVYIRNTSGIASCVYMLVDTPDPNNPGQKIKIPILSTEGENIPAMWPYEVSSVIDESRISTNNIQSVLKYYGVEACRASIVREMNAVFGGHGIDVDNRHLNLIADTMTREGGFKAFNRMSMASNSSPFAKMSFETSVNFLIDAVLNQDGDALKGPSGRIVVGRVGKVGTGGIDVLAPVE